MCSTPTTGAIYSPLKSCWLSGSATTLGVLGLQKPTEDANSRITGRYFELLPGSRVDKLDYQVGYPAVQAPSGAVRDTLPISHRRLLTVCSSSLFSLTHSIHF